MVCINNINEDFTSISCKMCGKNYIIFYNRESMIEWLSGTKSIQDALHYLSSNERELLLSETCGDCFDSLFSMLDNDE